MSSVRFFAVLGIVFLLGFGFYLLEGVLTPFIIAWFLAYLLVPLVDLLSRRMPREVAILAVFLIVVVVLAGILFGLVPALQRQVNVFLQQLPSFTSHLDTMLSHLFNRLHLHVRAPQISNEVQQALAQFGRQLVGALPALLNTARRLVEACIFIALVPVVAFYLLRDWHELTARMESFLRAPGQRVVEQLLRVSDQVLRGFVHGELLVMLGFAIMYTAGYMLTGISLGLVLGILAGLVCVIPFAAFALAGVPAILIAIAQFNDLLHPLLIILTIAAAELIGNAFLVPLLVGRFVKVHPAAVLLFIFVGGALFGVLGMILALPLAAVAYAYWDQFGMKNRHGKARKIARPPH